MAARSSTRFKEVDPVVRVKDRNDAGFHELTDILHRNDMLETPATPVVQAIVANTERTILGNCRGPRLLETWTPVYRARCLPRCAGFDTAV